MLPIFPIGEMVFMDYRFPLKAALETTYTDALGRPLLDIAGYNTFRQLSS